MDQVNSEEQSSSFQHLPGVAGSSLGGKGGLQTGGNPLKLLAALDQFEEATKRQIQGFSYMKDLESGLVNEEEELDVETLLEGIRDEDLDAESLIAKRRAQDKKAA